MMMEAGDCMKEMFKAVKQYVGNPSDNNLSKLNRNIYGLIALTHDSVSSVFNPRDALTMQCMSCLIDILDGAVVPDLFERIIVLLTKLVEDDSQCKLLTERYSLTNVLSILCIHKLSDSIQLLTKCLCLLQKITYINKVRFEDGFVDELVKFIIQFIPTNSLNVDNQQLCRVCVCLLANVCRNNLPVQTYVKNLRNIKQIYKTLVGFIAVPNKDFNIPSLSVLTCLYLHDDIGQNFFSPVNINQTFLLIFNVLVSSEPERSRKYAIDLVIDLIRHPHISDLLVSFQHLELTVKQVLNLLKSKALLDAGKLFELLLAFCSVSKLRSVVCRCVFESKDSEIHLIESIMAWIKQSSSPLSVLALSLVRELYEEAIDDGDNDYDLQINKVLPCCTEILMAPLPISQNSDSDNIKYSCQMIVCAVKLLSVLCNEERIKGEVLKSFDAEICYKIVDYQLYHNKVALSSDELDSWSNVGVEVTLYTLDLMVNQKRNVHNMDTTVVILLQDQRLMPILSHGLTSDRRDIVQLTLRLLFAGTQIPEFPSLMLGASIVANNQKIDHRANLNESHDRMSPIKKPLSKKNDLPEMFHQRTQHPDSRNTDIDGDIDILIEKMHSGIELDVKNLKLSQVIDIYEVKLQSLQTKESHLTDLLEAKSLALTQSDRLLSQYRNKRAEFDAETRQMRNLLKDTESKNYEYIEKLNELTSVKDKAIATVQAMKTEMYRLQSVSEDYERLMATHEEMQKRFDNAQNQITALQRENNTSKGVQDLLTKHNEQLKEQHNASLKQLEKLDENCKLMNKQLKERDAKLKDTNKKVKSLEDDVSRLKGEKDELDSKIVQLSKEVKQIEQEKKEAKHKISALQSDCTTYEREIKEKQLLLKQQQEKIDKHNQIAALIHNLSSGGPASGGSLNLNITDK